MLKGSNDGWISEHKPSQKDHPGWLQLQKLNCFTGRQQRKKGWKVLTGFICDAWGMVLERPVNLESHEMRTAHRIQLPEAIITAIALVDGLILLADDENDFINVTG